MTDFNASLLPFAEPVANIMGTLKVLVGGVFGLYVILFVIKLREYFVLKKGLKDIKIELADLKEQVAALSKKKKRRKKR